MKQACDDIILVALEGEGVVYNRDLVSTSGIPLQSPPRRLRISGLLEIGRLFSDLVIQLIETRTEILRLDYEPPSPPEPPNRSRLIHDRLKLVLIVLDLIDDEIALADSEGMIGKPHAVRLREETVNLRRLISEELKRFP